MPHTRLISFLGLGRRNVASPYEPTRYSLDGTISAETPLLERALVDLIPEISSILVLGTAEVKRQWFDSGAFAEEVSTPFELMHPTLPTGRTSEERWGIFDAMVRAMSLEPMESLGEQSAPNEIVVDVTHGFRLQPILGLSALSYVLSEWSRRQAENLPRIRILYGAWEARDENNISPVWDLTELVTAARWSAAVDALMRFGRADDFAFLGKIAGATAVAEARAAGHTGKDLGKAKYPHFLGNAVKVFADDLTLSRLANLLSESAPKLLEQLGKPEASALCNRLPPLREPIAELKNWLEPLCCPQGHCLKEPGLRASAYLADLLGRLQRFSEQAAVIREGLVTYYGLLKGINFPEPRSLEIKETRRVAENQWTTDGKKYQNGDRSGLSETGLRILDLSQRSMNDRNDVMHCGINDKPASSSDLRKRLTLYAEEFLELTDKHITVDRNTEKEQASSGFLNLSNHPISTWTADQIASAEKLGFGRPVELPEGMPLVPAEANTKYVMEMAQRIADQAETLGVRAAFVAGEPTLTFTLVCELVQRDIRCFSATTERQAEETPEGDEVVRRSTIFRFVRWREYTKR